jgi:hypothetical protein
MGAAIAEAPPTPGFPRPLFTIHIAKERTITIATLLDEEPDAQSIFWGRRHGIP